MPPKEQDAATAAEDFLTEDDLKPPQSNKIQDEDIRPTTKPKGGKEEFKKRDPSDPRPHAVVVPDYLKRKFGGRSQLPVSMDVSYKMLPPITRKRHAVYELIQETKIDLRIFEGDNGVKPPPTIMPPTYMFYDDGELDLGKREKLMKYVERSEIVPVPDPFTGQNVMQTRPVLGQVEFINGLITVPILEKYPLFVWMELCPWNASNRWRNTYPRANNLTLFRRIDTTHKSVHQELIRMDLERDADEYVRKISRDHNALVNLASALTNPTIAIQGVLPQALYHTLRLRAKESPEEILYKTPDKKASVRINLISALDLGILEYIPEHESYYSSWLGDKEPLLKVARDAENPLEDLCTFMLTADGEDAHTTIMDILGYWKG